MAPDGCRFATRFGPARMTGGAAAPPAGRVQELPRRQAAVAHLAPGHRRRRPPGPGSAAPAGPAAPRRGPGRRVSSPAARGARAVPEAGERRAGAVRFGARPAEEAARRGVLAGRFLGRPALPRRPAAGRVCATARHPPARRPARSRNAGPRPPACVHARRRTSVSAAGRPPRCGCRRAISSRRCPGRRARTGAHAPPRYPAAAFPDRNQEFTSSAGQVFLSASIAVRDTVLGMRLEDRYRNSLGGHGHG